MGLFLAIKRVMGMHTLDSEVNIVEDLTDHEVGDVDLWIGQQKEYCNVPSYVSNELGRRTSALPAVLTHLPSESLPIMQLLRTALPQVTESFQRMSPHDLFSFQESTHTSMECFQLSAPSNDFLTHLRACAGQAMLDGKPSIQHWERSDIFLPFDALGTWDYILQIIAAKKAWNRALQWMAGQPQAIPEQYTTHITSLLHQVPWKGYIKGLGSSLTITDMAEFLSQEWLSDSHIHCMLTLTKHRHIDVLSGADPRIPITEIIMPDFPSHILSSPLLATTPIAPDYFAKAPKSAISLGRKIANADAGIRIAAVAFSPPGHWACLLINTQTGTISWGDSVGRAVPSGFETRLRAWLELFIPNLQFSPMQDLLCAHQTDSYSCGIVAVNTLKHHIFGDELWTPSRREILRIQEFIDILEFSESWKDRVSIFFLP